MSVIKKIISIFNSNSLSSEDERKEKESVIPILEQLNIENELNQLAKETIQNKEELINANNRTLMNRLYILEQEISIFKEEFPNSYKAFMQRIETLREDYISTLQRLTTLTFEIDPESNGYKIGQVMKLEKDVKVFLEKEVKFNIISKRMQRLILKLNILYNVSIFHCNQSEKEKVLYRLAQALEVEKEIIHQFKISDYILKDIQLKEQIIQLISYLDYEFFKTSIRNSKSEPYDIIKKLVIIEQFDKFDYVTSFKSFMKEELSDFIDLLDFIKDNKCKIKLQKKFDKIVEDITYDNNEQTKLLDNNFWNNFFTFETSLLQILKGSGVEVKVQPISSMNINITENEVIILPITNVYISLMDLLFIKKDSRVLIVIKLLNNISKDITYEEVYFLLVLFDLIELIENIPNNLIKYIERYINKYQYSKKEINEKKQKVINSENKDYVFIFALDDYEKETIETLKKLNIDFKIIDGNLYMNTFYFKGLNNIYSSLQTNTQNRR